ncbi:MAG: biotin--[acetyl-CoA-carboxylase] ligase [Flavobacteriales bacterium]|nr:biotin--[acetyl-CoA-carboxylase] ligase [Flavobacteriia bacterium]NCP05491.1 biotin--[acetyl-CoA-carboxylase] ligase [Flavobacteriales bacterium]PIV92416.1 MAG: biotin--[acetyl-CoA-carboxylase] ligase [Flavobacteriaceae bacterium CG17_big_fil_post_rev_8_21_14_2_50_33_15]PIY11814.1 MAG: biotin--[acetyl-CoA-carboxylase] ligase [Flavobacteriaceae bacterium CG_4_10_14_3_um_filter_33_47]PJB16741.1 MAG: biotin--[acetyl-CoA-carboxylase] ligase [Flavobacteriaceae bacterium CG_4_9_14_3_um_filter_33_1
MHVIKLNATDSTNSYLRTLSNNQVLVDYTVVFADYQTQGRGQMGTIWSSESSKNLTVSVFKDVSKLFLVHPFYISMATSLAIIKTLHSFSTPKLSVKWPNDILSEDKKICGVLIENVIKQNRFKASIIGVGLNVNQTNFEDLPKATSLKLLTGTTFSLDEVLHTMIKFLKYYFMILRKEEYFFLKQEYESYLFRKNKPSTFKDAEGSVFSGIIKGISNAGNLRVLIEDDIVKEFDLKDVSLLY